MTTPDTATSPGWPPAPASPHWQPLPLPARSAFRLVSVLVWVTLGLLPVLAVVVMTWPTGRSLPGSWSWLFGVVWVLPVLGAAWGWWRGGATWRHTAWSLDADGLHLRRGRWWQSELAVARHRVQHIDLQRGPVDRRFGLATLQVHTAGTRVAAIRFRGLGLADAEAIRDALVRERSPDDDAL
ncbi:MAG: PH domain-containing protein [Rubrivivax sp.]|nr:PH domain-containing protein [Rubrivivax sp.]